MTDFFKSALGVFSGGSVDKPEQQLIGKIININKQNFKVRKILAQGGYAVVYEATETGTNKTVALKRLISYDHETNQAIMQEIEILKSLNGHPNIINYFSAASISNNKSNSGGHEFLILTELCKNGQLTSFMPSPHSQQPFTFDTILRIIYQTALAIGHMHTQKPAIIHRDLKIENLLLNEHFILKLCDFGSSTLETFEPNETWSVAKRGLIQERLERVTTPMYRAPEMLDLFLNFPINEGVDIWAFGCILFYLLATFHPFEDSAKLAILNASYKLPRLTQDLIIFTNLIQQLLLLDPRQRPKISEILSELKEIATSRNINPTGPIPLQNEVQRRSNINTPQAQAEETIANPHVRGATMPVPAAQQQDEQPAQPSVFHAFKKIIKDTSSKVAEVMQQQRMPVNQAGVDFSCVTSRLAVMSYPNETPNSMYGPNNNIYEVQATLDTQYDINYSVFNVSPHPYKNQTWFGGRFLHRPFGAHTAPNLISLVELCVNARIWLTKNPKNVCIIHCKDGKAASAVLLSAILLFCSAFKNVSSALQLFKARRAEPRLNASQTRYLNYITQMVAEPPVLPHNKMLGLISLTVSPVPICNKQKNGCKPFIEIYEGERQVFSNYQEFDLLPSYTIEDGKMEFQLQGLEVGGDITIMVYNLKSSLAGKSRDSIGKICQFQFFSGYVTQEQNLLEFSKVDLDHLDPTGGPQGFDLRYPEKFTVSLELLCLPQEQSRFGTYLVYPWETMLPRCDPMCCFGSDSEMNEIMADYAGIIHTPKHSSRQETRKSSPLSQRDDEDAEILGSQPTPEPSVSGFSKSNEWPSSTAPSAPPDSAYQTESFANFWIPDGANNASGLPEDSPPLQPNNPYYYESSSNANVDDLLNMGKQEAQRDWYNNESATNTTSTRSEYPFFKPADTSEAKDPRESASFINNPFFDIPVTEPEPASGPHANSGLFDFDSTPPQTQPKPAPKDPFADLGGLFDSMPKPQASEKPKQQTPKETPGFNPFGQNNAQYASYNNAQQQQPQQQSQQESTSRPRPRPSPNNGPQPAKGVPGAGFYSQDAFSDLLGGFGSQNRTSTQETGPKSMRQMQMQKETEHLDPETLQVRMWAEGKEKNLCALLCSLNLILWEGVRYQSVSMGQLMTPEQIKKAFRNAARAVHPDKWNNTPHQHMAKLVFMELNNAMLHHEQLMSS